MNDRMEQEINRTIALLQASMPRKKTGASLPQLIKIAQSEMSGLLLFVLFLGSLLFGVFFARNIASPMVTVFCISPLPMLILFHQYVLNSNEAMRELEETFPFSYTEMLVGRAALISAYMVFVFLSLAALLSNLAGGNFIRLALCGAIPSLYLCVLLLLLSVVIRNQEGLALAAIVLWIGISYCALTLPFDGFLIRLPTAVYVILLTVGIVFYSFCAYKIKQRRFSYAVNLE